MLIPRGIEYESLNRAPLVTFLWMGLTAAASIWFMLLPKSTTPSFRSAVALYRKHPELKADERLQILSKVTAFNPNPEFQKPTETLVYKIMQQQKNATSGRDSGASISEEQVRALIQEYEKQQRSSPNPLDAGAAGESGRYDSQQIRRQQEPEEEPVSDRVRRLNERSSQRNQDDDLQDNFEMLTSDYPNRGRNLTINDQENYENSNEYGNPKRYPRQDPFVQDRQQSANSEQDFASSAQPLDQVNSGAFANNPALKASIFRQLASLLKEEKRTPEQNQRELDRLTERIFHPDTNDYEWRLGVPPNNDKTLNFFISSFFTPSLLMLLLNLIVFYHLAPYLEDLWGRPLMVLFLLAAAGFSSLAYSYLAPLGFPPLLGLLAVTSAVYLANVVHYPRRKVIFVYPFISSFISEVRVSLLALVPVWVVFWAIFWSMPFVLMKLAFYARSLFWLETFARYMSGTAETNSYSMLSFLAIIPAMVFGFSFAGFMQISKLHKVLNPAITDLMSPRDRFQVEIDNAFSESKKELALKLLAKAHKKLPQDLDFHLRYWRQLVTNRAVKEHKEIGLTLLPLLLADGQLDPAFFAWEALSDAAGNSCIPLPLALELGKKLQASQRVAEAKKVFSTTFETLQAQKSPPLDLLPFFETWSEFDAAASVPAQKTYLQTHALKQELQNALSALEQREMKPEPHSWNQNAIPLASEPERPSPNKIHNLTITFVDLRSINAEGIRVLVGSGDRLFEWSQIKALGYATIEPPGAKKYSLLDLFTTDLQFEANRHIALRIRSSHLPMALLQKYQGDSERALAEMKAFVSSKTKLTPLPAQSDASDCPHFSCTSDFETAAYGIYAQS